jgi:hypothetical protein
MSSKEAIEKLYAKTAVFAASVVTDSEEDHSSVAAQVHITSAVCLIEKALSYYDGRYAINLTGPDLIDMPKPSEEIIDADGDFDKLNMIDDEIIRIKAKAKYMMDAITEIGSTPVDESKKIAWGYVALATQHLEQSVYFFIDRIRA